MSRLRVDRGRAPGSDGARPLLVFLGDGTTPLVRLDAAELEALYHSLRDALDEPVTSRPPGGGGSVAVNRDRAASGHRKDLPFGLLLGGSVLARMTHAEAREFLVSVESARGAGRAAKGHRPPRPSADAAQAR